MAKVFITGSADGLGLLAAKALIAQGHQVVLHARNEQRGIDALLKAPGSQTVLIGNLSDAVDTKALAAKANALGTFDAVIHNAGVYNAPSNEILAVNTLAPYLLTCLMHKPKRLVYIGSDMHEQGHAKLEAFNDSGKITYSDSKLHVLLLCKSVARKWPNVFANTVHPGWVPTKMGGGGAPDDLQKGFETQVWLSASDSEEAKVTGHYFYHKKQHRYNIEADDISLQEKFLAKCEAITAVSL